MLAVGQLGGKANVMAMAAAVARKVHRHSGARCHSLTKAPITG
jgi:hypothetical protein